MSDQGLRTGELAQRAEVNVQTLRYYERRGLLALRPTTVQPTGRADPERDDCQVQAQRARGPGDLQLRRHPKLPGGNRPFLWDGHRLLHTSVVAILRQHRPVGGVSASGQRPEALSPFQHWDDLLGPGRRPGLGRGGQETIEHTEAGRGRRGAATGRLVAVNHGAQQTAGSAARRHIGRS
jgi:hypothetical protein